MSLYFRELRTFCFRYSFNCFLMQKSKISAKVFKQHTTSVSALNDYCYPFHFFSVLLGLTLKLLKFKMCFLSIKSFKAVRPLRKQFAMSVKCFAH